jgi:3-oxoacyl-[acyl-carrier-protein] synthase-3
MNDYLFPESPVALSQPSGTCARVVATATALPETIVTNQAIVQQHGHQVSADTMRKIVGVAERRVAAKGVVDSDLLLLAAQRCLAEAKVGPNELGKLIVTKFLGDRVLPMTASLLQRKLGCDVAMQALDIDGGIHGFLQAMEVAATAIAIGEGPVLIVSGGVINRLVSRTDPRLAFQYGDGAAAVLLVPAEQSGVLARYGFTNREFIDVARGFNMRESFPKDLHETGAYDSLYELYRQDDFKPSLEFVCRAMQKTVDSLLAQAGRTMAEVDLFLLTETHHHLWTSVLRHLGIEPSRSLSLLPRLGNTMSAMLPMLLDEARRTGKVAPGALVMLLSVGEGLSGGGMLLSI